MEKLTQTQRNEIVLMYKLDNSKANISKICADYGISERYLFKLAKKNKEQEIVNSTLDNSSEFSKRCEEIIKKALDRLEDMVVNDPKATISQVSTALGILYDKSRLENNQSTENKAININIKIEK